MISPAVWRECHPVALSGEAAVTELLPAADAAALAITAVLWDDAFAASPAAVRAGLH
jgi:hypothetical protein